MRRLNKYRRWYRRPHTTAERRANSVTHVGPETDAEDTFCRAKRNFHNLPSAYDDIPNAKAELKKSWKVKRKKQYRVKDLRNGWKPAKIKEYTYTTSDWRERYNLASWLNEQDIPHRVFEKRRKVERQEVVTKEWGRIPGSQRPLYFFSNHRKCWIQSGFKYRYGWYDVEPHVEKRVWYVTDRYTVKWWFHSEIDLKKILAKGA